MCGGGGWEWGSRPWVGGGHCPGLCSGWFFWSGWLPQFSSARALWPFLDCGAFTVDAMVVLLDMNCNTVLGVPSFHRLSIFTQSDFQCPLSFSHVHLWAIYRGSHTPLLSVSALGSCSSPALILFLEFSLVWRQASPPEGHRPFNLLAEPPDVGGAQYQANWSWADM